MSHLEQIVNKDALLLRFVLFQTVPRKSEELLRRNLIGLGAIKFYV